MPDGATKTGTSTSGAASKLLMCLQDGQVTQIMEAHNGMGALLATRAGFDAVWASSFAVSASLGLRDNDELTWAEHLHAVAFMVEATDAPVLIDGNSGFGNFNTARRFAARAAAGGAGGICLEDKQFPKLNSFAGGPQRLEATELFCGKIAACKDTVGESLVLVARTEALIAGASLDEALERAAAYRDAGADAIFIHSKRSDASQIEAFCEGWDGSLPVVISPTTYASTPMSEFERFGLAGVIWGNQGLRAAVTAMHSVYSSISNGTRGDHAVDGISTMEEIFELLDYGELEAAEGRYEARR